MEILFNHPFRCSRHCYVCRPNFDQIMEVVLKGELDTWVVLNEELGNKSTCIFLYVCYKKFSRCVDK